MTLIETMLVNLMPVKNMLCLKPLSRINSQNFGILNENICGGVPLYLNYCLLDPQ